MTLRKRSIACSLAVSLALAVLTAVMIAKAATANTRITPDPIVDDHLDAAHGQRMAVLAGGCFWGVQLVFEHVKGVLFVTAGYAGGSTKNPSYEMVSSGLSGHAESVKIIYDPAQVTYGTLLKVFFSVAHDPTEVNRQGPDQGTQYRSIIFYNDADQQRIAQAYIDQTNNAKIFDRKIATQLVPYQPFYQAEAYHQDFAIHNQANPYIYTFDLPKLQDLRKSLPDLYVKN
jgi:peptide-methionine (S)-S-oxide reductase